MKPQTYTLSNGLRVIFINTEVYPTLSALLLIGAGSRYENPENNGVAHFFEHMAFKGSKKYSNSFVIASTIEGLGGIFNAFTSKDHTGYWIKSIAEHYETVIDVLSDMILNPLLLDAEIEREKGVIMEEINLYEDTPYRKVGDIFESLLYKNNPLGYDITGSKKTVSHFTRKTFTDYIGALYHPKNSVLVIAGGFQKPIKHYLDIAERKFSKWENNKRAVFEKVEEQQSKPQSILKYKKTEQAHFCLGFRAFSLFDPRKYTLSVLSAILGGGMSSRLFIEVREKRGLCYYISTGRELYHDVGNIVTQVGVANNLDKIKEAIEVILKEHKKLTRGEIQKEELKNAKELLKGRFLLSMEDSFNVASFFGNKAILENTIQSPEETIKKIEAVKIEDVVSLASEIFQNQKLNFTMISSFNKENINLDNLSI